MEYTADYTPDPHYMESMRNSRLGWHNALAEMIDNSFDAGALQVTVEVGGKAVSVSDDGGGAPDVMSMVKLGSHKKHRSTSVGMYGVGLKEAWHWLGNTIDITTHCKGQCDRLRVSPGDIKKVDGKLVGPSPVSEPSPSGAKGTRISIEGVTRGKPKERDIDKLGMTFMPALDQGRQLVIKDGRTRKAVEGYSLPVMTECVSDSFDVDGRATTILIGMMAKDATAKYPGFLLCYGHRVIANAFIGTGGRGVSLLSGKIVLGHGWKVTKNKDDLSDYQDRLDEEVYKRISHLCDAAANITEDIESRELLGDVSESLNHALSGSACNDARERREPASISSGRVLPSGSPRKRKKAAKFDPTQNGSVEVSNGKSGRRGRVSVQFYNADSDDPGYFDYFGRIVFLNEANTFIASIKSEKNKAAITAMAMGIIAHYDATHDEAQLLAFESDNFGASWGRLLHSMPTNGGAA